MINLYVDDKYLDYVERIAYELKMDEFLDADLIIDLERIDHDGAAWGDMDQVTIEISNQLTEEQTMITIAHEMVHAFQMFDGTLVSSGLRTYYRGQDMTDVPYDKREFEIEAYYLEKVLYNRCK